MTRYLLIVALMLTGCTSARHYFVIPVHQPPDIVCDPPPLHPDVAIGSNWCKRQAAGYQKPEGR